MKAAAKIFFLLAFIFAASVPAGAVCAPRPQASPAAAPAAAAALAQQEALRADVEFLSDSLCAGRATGTRGCVEAAAYIIRRLSAMGCEPSVQSFRIDSARVGHNILVIPETSRPVIVLTAYYDGLGVLDGRLYPGADSNASGVAALLSVAARLRDRADVLIAFLDAHNANLAGADALRRALKGRRIQLLVNFDILGSTLAPVDKFWPDFLIALGADRHRALLEECNAGLQLHYYHTYYRSRTFTEVFYRRVGDQRAFLADGVPTIVFTSGITDFTNKPGDTPETLDYPVFAKRVEFISRFISRYGR